MREWLDRGKYSTGKSLTLFSDCNGAISTLQIVDTENYSQSDTSSKSKQLFKTILPPRPRIFFFKITKTGDWTNDFARQFPGAGSRLR